MSLSNCCRLCGHRCEEGKSLYDDSGQPNALHEIIVKYFHPTVIDIGKYRQLTSICRQCWRQIWKFCNFQKSVHEAQLKLYDQYQEDYNLTTSSGQNSMGKQNFRVQNTSQVMDQTFDDLINIESATNCISLQPVTATVEIPTSHSNQPAEEFVSMICVKEETNISENTEPIFLIEDSTESSEDSRNNVVELKSEDSNMDNHPVEDTTQEDMDTLCESDLTDCTERPLRCDICNKFVRTKKALRLHKNLYHLKIFDNQPAECKICHCVLENNMALYVHYNCGHKLTTYSFSCPQCNELFNIREQYHSHLKLDHGQDLYSFDHKSISDSDSNGSGCQSRRKRRKQIFQIRHEEKREKI